MVVDLRSRKRASVASVVGDPQNLNGPLATTVSDRQPESSLVLEIGSLFVKAQRFADETAREAERKAQEVIFAAEAKAAEIFSGQRPQNGLRGRRTPRIKQKRQRSASMMGGRLGRSRRKHRHRFRPRPSPLSRQPSRSLPDANRTLSAELVKLRLALGESSAAVPEGQHLHPEGTALTSNSSNGALLLPSSG